MSFSTDVKSELCSVRTDNAAAEAECHGMLVLCRSFSFDKIIFQTACCEAAEHFVALLRRCFDVFTAINVGGSKKPTYTVEVTSDADRKRILFSLGYKYNENLTVDFAKIKTDGNLKAFIRGAFLSGGNLSEPEKEYRAEFSFKSNDTAADFVGLLDSKGFEFSLTYRAGKFLVYTKNSETIEEFLTYIGAEGETLNLIGVKVVKSVRNRVNRRNNFETSNILKTANAAYTQRQAIEKIKHTRPLETLPDELYEVALLRLNNPEAPLSELCKLSSVKLTRSGFNHRMQKLLEIAKNIK